MKDVARITAWDNLLNSRIPLLSTWLRRQTAKAASSRARGGNVNACAALARALDGNTDPVIQSIARETILGCRSPYCLDAAWQVWARSRTTRLTNVLIEAKRPAKMPPLLRVLSLLLLQDTAALATLNTELVGSLVSACEDLDQLISSRARFALVQLKSAAAISVLCRLWAQTRSPLLENALSQAGYQPDKPAETRILVALKFNRLNLVTQSGAEIVPPLLASCDDADHEIQERARFCLLNLQNVSAINELCALWVRDRSDLPAKAIIQARYVAQHPVPVRLLSALKAGRLDVAQNATSEGLSVLLASVNDQDREVASNANQALHSLTASDTREKLCDLAIEEENSLAAQIALEAGYLPRMPERRALYLFLTNQWSAYETIDFDQHLLNAVYSTATNTMRQRIMRKIQQTGRTDFLTILAGSDHRSRAAALTPIESQLLVRMLAGNREWEKLWLLVRELDLAACRDALTALSASGFRPGHPDEETTFTRLSNLAARPLSITKDELENMLPPAVPRATIKLNGRVNDVAFAPDDDTRLAIALGSGRVVLWDYQEARIEAIHRGFAHSVSQVAYTQTGILLAAERAATPSECGLFLIANSHIQQIGKHAASITVLEPLPDNRVFTASRDSAITLWDIVSQRAIQSRSVNSWARAACVSPDKQTIILLKQSLEAIKLDELQPLPLSQRRTSIHNSVYRAAAVISDKLDLLAGMYNGSLYSIGLEKSSPPPKKIGLQRGAFVGIQMLPDHNLIFAASAGADLCVYSHHDLRLLSSLVIHSDRLTSLEISPDRAFMATGTGDSSMTLWDLRLLNLPAMFSRPLAAEHPRQIATINSLLEIQSLPEPVRNTLTFYQALLQYRFAFDIHISEARGIHAGEFDVLID